MGFEPLKNDESGYTSPQRGAKTIVLAYVDDILITRKSQTALNDVRKVLQSSLKLAGLRLMSSLSLFRSNDRKKLLFVTTEIHQEGF